MTDLNNQPKNPGEMNVESFNASVKSALVQIRKVANDAIVGGEVTIAVGLAASLIAAEVTHFAGSNEGRTDLEIVEMVSMMAKDMIAHTQEICRIVREKTAASVEEVPACEVVNG